LQAELITELGAIAPLEDEWRELAELRGNAFITPEWFRAWWDQRPESIEPLVVAVRDHDGALAGVVPLVLDCQRRPRAIRFAGATWGDRFGLAARVEREPQVAAAAMAAIEAEGLDRYMLHLDHVEANAFWWTELRRSAAKRLAMAEQQHFEIPRLDLSGLDWDTYLASCSSNFRQQLRRRERRLKDGRDIQFRTATEETLDRDLAHLFSLHERRWADRASSLQTPGVIPFLRDLAEAMLGRGWLRLRLLEADGVPVAGFLGWRLGGVYTFYQSGFDPDWASMSVGTVMMADTIRSAIEEGAGQFDMLLGNEPYKLRFANDSYTVQTIVVTRAMHPNRLLASGEAWARRNGARLRGRPGFERVNKLVRRLLPTADRF
jgi:CelD/BcsL family acetyltransferase involved in cellulose biosynthesis